MKKTMPEKTSEQGFTLIELSIVLVIIGLIVGGVLVGQDLIKAAQIRATIAQIDGYDAAVNTFRNKYNGVPGDEANGANFFAAADVPVVAQCPSIVSGNNVLDDKTAARTTLSCEPAAFWLQLALANLIGDQLTDTNLVGGTAAVSAPATIAKAFPGGKIGNGNFIVAYTGNTVVTQPGMAGSNLYRIAGISAVAATGVPTFANYLTPLEAFQIDSKKDDGVYNTGTVQAIDALGSFNAAADIATPGAATCVNNAATPVYNTVAANGNNRLCQLAIRASF